VATAVETELARRKFATARWDHGNFPPGGNVLQSVKRLILRSRGVVLVMTPDHTMTFRDTQVRVPRDNLVFEFGLSVGLLGDDRTFVLRPSDSDFRLPSDTGGVNYLAYDMDEPDVSIATACQEIARTLGKPTRMSVATWYESLEKLAETVNGAEARKGFQGIDLVVGVNPGGAAIGGMLYFVGKRFFQKSEFLAFSPEMHCKDELKAVIRSLVSPPPGRRARILVIDASIKRGVSMEAVVALIRDALGGEDKVEVRTAVLIDLPQFRDNPKATEPDYVVAPEAYEAFPYGLA